MNKMFAIREQLIHIQHSGPQTMGDLPLRSDLGL